MNGDILSDLASGLVGGLGFAPSANLGSDVAMFEAVHGTAPGIAGQDKANPTALVLSAAQMLRHLGEARAADDVEHALLLAMREGARTADLPGAGPALGTAAFADAVIARLGRRLDGWAARPATALRMPAVSAAPDFVVPATRRAVGADVFVESALDAESLGRALERLVEGTSMRLLMVSNRGTQLYPAAGARTDAVDHWRCRFVLRDADDMLDNERLLGLLSKVGRHFVWMHVEKLNEFDGAAGFTKAQGQA
jgi:isocitrate dehydrogenase